jgi:hypothetical protein
VQAGRLGQEVKQVHEGSSGQKSENRAARRSDPRARQRSQVDSQAARTHRNGCARKPQRARDILVAGKREKLKYCEGGKSVAKGGEQRRT